MKKIKKARAGSDPRGWVSCRKIALLKHLLSPAIRETTLTPSEVVAGAPEACGAKASVRRCLSELRLHKWTCHTRAYVFMLERGARLARQAIKASEGGADPVDIESLRLMARGTAEQAAHFAVKFALEHVYDRIRTLEAYAFGSGRVVIGGTKSRKKGKQ